MVSLRRCAFYSKSLNFKVYHSLYKSLCVLFTKNFARPFVHHLLNAELGHLLVRWAAMCFGAFFSGSDQKRKSSQSHSKSKRQNVRSNSLHRGNTSTVTKIPERKSPERKSPERPNSKRTREPSAKVDRRVRPSYTQNHGGNYRPHLVVQAPCMPIFRFFCYASKATSDRNSHVVSTCRKFLEQ